MSKPRVPEWHDDIWGIWWRSHQRGTGGRPRPGTRVRITENTRYRGREGTVIFYEGQWNSMTFPVRIDGSGLTLLFTGNDIVELPGVPAPAPEKRSGQ
ncbi:hypothetical protein [Amycolatopsis sp. CA-230715]|uniref:hypothetical protein n=1 Tax=Amycolatopsis sp. CA-230715 TaxID=2745196 RepID=UPI001C017F7D|nr:hypothetical protein [Amycolatopsis sp. CA-230715]QWF78931.1 hypothetical protein HUW46_02330 [Amycolatopsis sp. CA-230715]